MGSRLVVLVKSDTGWEFYYDHWAAQTIGCDIAIDGAQATLERVRDMSPVDIETPDEWAGAIWIEGTLLIDTTTRTVIWAEESCALYMPRLINYLIEHTWPEWTAVWSSEGTTGTLRAAGVISSAFPKVGTHRKPSPPSFLLLPWEKHHGADPITVRMPTGELVTWRATGFLDDLIDCGPANFLELAHEIACVHPSESETWTETRGSRIPTTGIVVDFPARSLRWWSVQDEDLDVGVFEALWPKWTLTSCGDNYEWHQELAGEIFRSWRKDLEECRSQITYAIHEGARANPFVDVATTLSDHGYELEVNVSALNFTPAKRHGDMTYFNQLLDAVHGSPLPPARIVDRHGTITHR